MSNDVQICFVVRGGTMYFICVFRYEWNMNDLFFNAFGYLFAMVLEIVFDGFGHVFVFDMVVDNYGLWIWF